MKKLFLFIMAVSFAITLSACGEKKTDTTAQNDVNIVDKDAFSSIEDATSKSITLKCAYTDVKGNGATLYFKNNVIRADAAKAQPTDPLVSEIIKDNKIYIWSEGSEQGMLIDFSLIKPGDDTFKMDDTPIYSASDIIKKIDEQKQNCVKEDAPDSLFEVPVNIQFPIPGAAK
jgi:hypothetical protein